ncbi:alpha/beta hydrolase [Granulosicoccaceae sp. 1_MG-2023]|nr:alpha/beta hydrolase [Granulosicoccaceae sp. 1_MG-2023]
MFTIVQQHTHAERILQRWRNLLLVLLLPLLLNACAVSSGERVRDIAERRGFSESTEYADGFGLAVFRNNVVLGQGGALHIYLEGDGTPWLFGRIIATDPTPWNPLMLRLMSQDRQAAYYVGRPCYNGFARQRICQRELWTRDRHGEVVVSAMAQVIERLFKRSGAASLHLYGHSGGGAMAMLLAPRLPQVAQVVTLAGNLNLSGWTRLHGYTPLSGSLDPAAQPALGAQIRQWHLAGAEDKNVPPFLARPVVQRQADARLYVLAGFGHTGGWENVWGDVLAALRRGREPRFKDVGYSLWVSSDGGRQADPAVVPELSFPASAE